MASLPAFTGSDLFATRSEPKALREHQRNAITLIKQSLLAGNRRIVCQMPTGAGKTVTAAEIIGGALRKGNRVAFTVPAISLVDQTVEAFEGQGVDAIGVIQASHPRTNRAQPVQVVSVQSLAKRVRPEADVVIVDECHMRFKAVSDWMAACPRTVFVGLSATPWARGMADEWHDLVVPVTMADLIGRSFLSPFRVFAPSHPDLSGVKIVAGDYNQDQLGEVMSGRTIVADVVQTWLAKAKGLPTLVFAVDRAHAARLVEQFAEAGIRMGYCDAHVDLIERKLLFARMARGEISGIVNIGTLTTGVDADVRCVVLARPTRSEMLFVQMIGRALRTAPGKEDALILDHADNHARLGFVTDIHHPKLLSGASAKQQTKSEKGEPMPKECGSCGLLKPAKVHRCPGCGFAPERQSDVEVEAGELVEMRGKPTKADMAAKQRFWSMARYVDMERGKGGKLAKALYRERFGVWPKGLHDGPVQPDGAFLGYERSRRIAFAKRRSAR
ncbi:DEAD/DEAH box helicase [Sphingomonas crocodyli]|uniref:DEAD/DEAH box helicase n=1 Tax=Sphingomonas crocodyli TaxID=1979270 RepID=A0A437M894_9SPHN|nr:DEAD/DEAH box helicase [Sphingomonas crocodyli]RVT93714.1 DEAD/DEAH box helicase [Sphingomonas crocodyli]